MALTLNLARDICAGTQRWSAVYRSEARLPGKPTRRIAKSKNKHLPPVSAAFWLTILLFCFSCSGAGAHAQANMQQPKFPANGTPTGMTAAQSEQNAGDAFPNPEASLQTGIQLTRQGRFADAIPYLRAARGHIAQEEDFAVDFDLSLCYVGIGQSEKAIPILLALRKRNPGTVNVENLLAQAYIGARKPKPALEALHRAAALDPHDENLYIFATDACTESRAYNLGLEVADLGLAQLPRSARLHYQRGIFLSHLDRSDLATKEFQLAAKYAPGQPIAFMGAAQAALLNGNMPGAATAARQGLHKNPDNYILLVILGKALVRSGAIPGQPEFAEALTAMEKAVRERPDHADAQVTLGNLYLMDGKLKQAIEHLEQARAIDPQDTSVYAHLATAYRRSGNMKKVRQMLETLAHINQQNAASYRSGPGNDRKGYLGGMAQQPPNIPHLE